MSWKRTVYAAWVAQVFSLTGFMIVMPFLPLYVRVLGVEDRAAALEWAGIVGAAGPAAMAVFAPIWGAVADRYGRKLMVMRAMFGGAVVLALMAMCQNVHQLVICRLAQGVMTGTVTANVALVAGVAPKERSGYALGMMQAAVFFGVALGPFLGGTLAHHFGYRWAFFFAAFLLLVGATLVTVFVQDVSEHGQSKDRAGKGSFREVLGAPGFITAIFVLFAVRFGASTTRPVFPEFVSTIYLKEDGLEQMVGMIASSFGLTAAISSGLLGRLGDSLGHKKLLIISTFLAAGMSGLLVMADSIPDLFMMRIGFGCAAGVMTPAANSIIRAIAGDNNLGKAFGMTTALSAAGWASGQFTGGYTAALLGLRVPFVLTAVLLAFAGLLIAWRIDEARSLKAPATEPAG